MSEASLRRSTRRNSKHREKYAAGDIVELTRAGALAHGRLVIELSEDPPRWLVTFDDDDLKDEELSQNELGAVVSRANDSDTGGAAPPKSGDVSKPKTNLDTNSTTTTTTNNNHHYHNNNNNNNNSKKKPQRRRPSVTGKGSGSGLDSKSAGSGVDSKAGSGSDESGSPGLTKKRKNVPSTNEMMEDEGQINADTDESPTQDSYSRSSSKSKVSDREQRSRRRQQMIEEDKLVIPYVKPTHVPHLSSGLPSPSKKVKTKGNDDVVKIPMLTGTLYLYRGARRRVAFVRKV